MAGKRVLTRSASDASSRLETQTSVPAPLFAMRKASVGQNSASRRDTMTPFRRKSSDVANLIASSVGVVVDGTAQRRSTRRSSIAIRKSASLRRKTSLPEQATLLPFNRKIPFFSMNWKMDFRGVFALTQCTSRRERSHLCPSFHDCLREKGESFLHSCCFFFRAVFFCIFGIMPGVITGCLNSQLPCFMRQRLSNASHGTCRVQESWKF